MAVRTSSMSRQANRAIRIADNVRGPRRAAPVFNGLDGKRSFLGPFEPRNSGATLTRCGAS